jgi:hypothetical protein
VSIKIIDSQSLPLNLQAVADQIVHSVGLAADRVALHTAEPSTYPIDATAGSIEQLLLGHLTSKPQATREAIVQRTRTSLTSPDRIARLGALAHVDLRAATPILQQTTAALGWNMPIGLADTIRNTGVIPAFTPPAAAPAAAAGTYDDSMAVVRCRIRKVTCVDETNPEINPDDMLVGGSITNDKGKSTKVAQMELGEFNDTDKREKVYRAPKWFATSALAAGIDGDLRTSAWPKEFIATIVLCEEDNGGFPEVLDKLLDFVKEKLKSWVSTTVGAAVGAALGTSLFPGLGTVVGGLIGALVGAIFDGLVKFFKDWWEDDEMPAITSVCKVDGYREAPVVTSAPVTYRTTGQGGEYKVQVDWQVSWPTGFGTRVDSAVAWNNGKIYFFKGSEYARYDIDEDRLDEGYPRAISSGWPGLWKEGVHAGVLLPSGKAYFFRGDEYIRYDAAADKADPGYPKKIKDGWKGVWADGIDAALFNMLNGKLYFFKGSQYVRYDVSADRVDPGYPLPIGPNWPDSFSHDLDAATSIGLTAYFFRGEKYINYSLLADKAASGDRTISYWWPGL